MEKKQLAVIVVAMVLLGIYSISLFASPMSSSTRSKGNSNNSNIINYRLDNYTRYDIIQRGATIMTFEYDGKCNNCADQKHFLEENANEFKNQLLLEEILNSTFTSSKLIIESKYGNKTFTNPTENDTFYALCDLLSMPPTSCLTGK